MPKDSSTENPRTTEWRKERLNFSRNLVMALLSFPLLEGTRKFMTMELFMWEKE
ncbi:MAG: hypothetical protein ACO1QB_11920 [Verrucomicrobiales bacterium]